MSVLYPLRFHPIFRRYLWGGRRLETVLGLPIGPGDDYAESWEITDHGADQSVVAAGALAGTTLGQLVADHGTDLLGRHAPQPRFPLLLKFLDARRTLSVQVHPDDALAAQADPPDLGKSEAWLVLDTEPGSKIYAGLKAGVDRQAMTEALAAGQCESLLHQFEPRVGDCVFIPAGTVHALGEGLLIAEIQQSSDITYRLYDWDRMGTDGKPRPLQIEQGLRAVNFQRGEVDPQTPEPTGRPAVWRLVSCDKFVLDRWDLDAAQVAGGDEICHILSIVDGAVEIEGDQTDGPLERGQTVLLPAAAGEVCLRPLGSATVLDAYLP